MVQRNFIKIQSSTLNMPISWCTCRKYFFKRMAWLFCAHEVENDYLNDIKAECYTKPCQMRNDTTNRMLFDCLNMLFSRYNGFGCIFNFHFQLNCSSQIIVVIILFRQNCSFLFSLFWFTNGSPLKRIFNTHKNFLSYAFNCFLLQYLITVSCLTVDSGCMKYLQHHMMSVYVYVKCSNHQEPILSM